MMRYTVTWHHEAEDELTELWLVATDRNEITAAVRAIDVALGKDASEKGETVAEGLRSLIAPPLRILFAIREHDRVAQVELVRRMA
jgi:hypothetical protein